MQVEYEIQNTIFGKGIFAKEQIKKGKCIWKYSNKINVIEYDETRCKQYLESLTCKKEAIKFLDLTYGRKEKLCLIIDDGKYMNHSDRPNCKTNMETGNVYAIKDINFGEELFEDYTTFEHPSYLFELLEVYKCKPDYYNFP
jgi:SET domain-containing protein